MRNRYLAIFIISCVATFLSTGVFAQDLKDINKQIEELEKKIQRAADVEEIKNLMSLMSHVFGLDAGVKKTPGQCFGQADGYMYGAFIKRSENIGGDQMQGPAEEGPGRPSGSAPEGAPGPAGQGGPKGLVTLDKLDFHMLTTSVIEIAEDGQTAKAIWYTPGMVGNTWMYENYACDFVKEDGEWRSWHRIVVADFSTPSDESWTDSSGASRGGPPMGDAGARPTPSQANVNPLPGGTGKDVKTVVYEGWSPTTLPQYKPKPPMPYKTFDETFSYCPPMPKDLEEMLWRENLMF